MNMRQRGRFDKLPFIHRFQERWLVGHRRQGSQMGAESLELSGHQVPEEGEEMVLSHQPSQSSTGIFCIPALYYSFSKSSDSLCSAESLRARYTEVRFVTDLNGLGREVPCLAPCGLSIPPLSWLEIGPLRRWFCAQLGKKACLRVCLSDYKAADLRDPEALPELGEDKN